MVNSILFLTYTALGLLLMPAIAVGILVRWRRRFLTKGLVRWSQRWGRLPPEALRLLRSGGGWWWVHAVSVGEVKAIEPFLKRIPERAGVRVLLSVVTPEAIAWATGRRLADVVIAAPIDLPWVVRRIAMAVRPAWFITVESEFWPNLLHETGRCGAKVALINGRLSERSTRSYHRIRWAMKVVWDSLDVVAVRQEEDAARFRSLGVAPERIVITGNLKFDVPLPPLEVLPDEPGKWVVTLGSTREGEESLIAEVLAGLRTRYPDLRLIWAPRHVDRTPKVEAVLNTHGLRAVRRSAVGMHWDRRTDLIWDTMGNLSDAFLMSHLVIMGGSFVPKGGQNPLEPAALGKAVLFGPSMENFRGIADAIVQEGGARQVTQASLAQDVERLLVSPAEREALGAGGRRFLESRQGATERTLDLLLR